MVNMWMCAISWALVVSGVSGFRSSAIFPTAANNRLDGAIQMKQKEIDGDNKFEEVFKPATVLAAFLFSNVAFVAPAFADFGDSSMMLSGRAGGRSGGRAGGRAMSSSRPAPPRTVERRTTIINAAPPSYGYGSPVIMAPSYNPMPGLGLSLGLNAIGSIGTEIREYNQEREIQDGRRELAETRAREQALEQRLQMLEIQQRGALSPQ